MSAVISTNECFCICSFHIYTYICVWYFIVINSHLITCTINHRNYNVALGGSWRLWWSAARRSLRRRTCRALTARVTVSGTLLIWFPRLQRGTNHSSPRRIWRNTRDPTKRSSRPTRSPRATTATCPAATRPPPHPSSTG